MTTPLFLTPHDPYKLICASQRFLSSSLYTYICAPFITMTAHGHFTLAYTSHRSFSFATCLFA